MTDKPHPTCHACNALALVVYRILPKGRNTSPVTVNTCLTHHEAATKIGRILSTVTHYGEPVFKKLGD